MTTETKNTKAFYNTEIPSDWEVKHFEDVADIDRDSLNGSTPKDYEFDYISLSDVDSDDFKIETTKQVFATAPSRARRIVKYGDILMSTVRPNLQGFSLIRNEVKDLIASTGFAVISTKKCSNEFLFQYLFSSGIERQFYQLLVGSNYPAINSSDVRKLKIPLPPLPEQKAIAQVLSTADAAIHTTEKIIAQKELRKKWLMQQLLTGKKRLKGFGGEWKEKKLGKLFNQIRNINDGGDSHSVMTISSKRGLISQEDKFDRVIAGDSLKKYTQLIKGDFAYNKGNSKTYPMGCIYRLEEKESALVPFVYICFTPTDLVDGMFYKHWFLAHGLDRQLNKIITSGARGDGLLNVNTDDFFGLKIIYPPKEEQTAISLVLQAADKEISLLKAKAEKLREQKKGLMQVLLTGKIRLNYDSSDFYDGNDSGLGEEKS